MISPVSLRRVGCCYSLPMSSIVRFDAETSLFVIGLRFGLGDLQFQWQAPHTRAYETPLAVAATNGIRTWCYF